MLDTLVTNNVGLKLDSALGIIEGLVFRVKLDFDRGKQLGGEVNAAGAGANVGSMEGRLTDEILVGVFEGFKVGE